MNRKTATALKRLRWPKSLTDRSELSVSDTYRVGKLIVNKVRAGQGRAEGTSVRDLAKLLGSSPATLYRTVRAYQMIEKYDLQNKLDKVPATLLYNLERLPSGRRRRFLARALKLEWSKREIVRQVITVLEDAHGEDWKTQRVWLGPSS